jgi:hypothetical protein
MTPRFTQRAIEISIERKSKAQFKWAARLRRVTIIGFGFGARYTTGCRQFERVILIAGGRGPTMNSELCT